MPTDLEITYVSTKPERTFKEKLLFFLAFVLRVVCPPIILFDLLRVVCRFLFGGMVGRKIARLFANPSVEKSQADQEERNIELDEAVDPKDSKNASIESIDKEQEKPLEQKAGRERRGLERSQSFHVSSFDSGSLRERYVVAGQVSEHRSPFSGMESLNGIPSFLARDRALLGTRASSCTNLWGLVDKEPALKNKKSPILERSKSFQELLSKKQISPKKSETSPLKVGPSLAVESYDRSLKIEERRFLVQTYDETLLETVEFYPNPNSWENSFHIVNFYDVGCRLNNDICEDIRTQAMSMKCTAIAFQHRDNHNCTDELVIDGISEVQRLLIEKKIPPENVILVGGGIAALVAAYFNKKGQRVAHFNFCSFSTLTNLIVARIRAKDRSGYRESKKGKILGVLAYPFIKFGLWFLKQEVNAVSAFREIHEDLREHILIRSVGEMIRYCTDNKGKRKSLSEDEDPIIIDDLFVPHYASLHKALQKEDRHGPLAKAEEKLSSGPEKAMILDRKKMEGKFQKSSISCLSLSKLISRGTNYSTSFGRGLGFDRIRFKEISLDGSFCKGDFENIHYALDVLFLFTQHIAIQNKLRVLSPSPC